MEVVEGQSDDEATRLRLIDFEITSITKRTKKAKVNLFIIHVYTSKEVIHGGLPLKRGDALLDEEGDFVGAGS